MAYFPVDQIRARCNSNVNVLKVLTVLSYGPSPFSGVQEMIARQLLTTCWSLVNDCYRLANINEANWPNHGYNKL